MNSGIRLLILAKDDTRTAVARALDSAFPALAPTAPTDAAAFAAALREPAFDLVILDCDLPWGASARASSCGVLAEIKARWPQVPVVVFTAQRDIEAAVAIMKAGAIDYIVKTPQAYAQLVAAARNALTQAVSRNEINTAVVPQPFEGIPIGLYRIQPDGKILYANDAMVQMSGCPDRATLMRTDARVFSASPEHFAKWQHLVETSEQLLNFEGPARKFDGSLVWVQQSAHAVRDGQGHTLCYEGSFLDVTTQRQTRLALKERAALIEMLQTVAMAANQSVNIEEALLVSLERICTYTGWPVGHVRVLRDNKNVLAPTELWHLDEPERFATLRQVTTDTPEISVTGLIGRVITSRRPVWIADIATHSAFKRGVLCRNLGVHAAFGFPILAQGTVHAVLEFFSASAAEPNEQLLRAIEVIGGQLGHVMERKRAEYALIESRRELQTLLSNLPGFAYRCHADGKPVFISEGVVTITGYAADDYVAKRVAACRHEAHPDDRPRIVGAIQSALEKHEPFELTYRIHDRAGREKWVWERGRGIYGTNNMPVWIEGFIADITERKRAEQRLLESEARLRRLVDSNIIGIVFWDVFGNISDANDAFLDLLDYTRADLQTGLRWDRLTPPEQAHLDQHGLAEIAASGRCTPYEKDFLGKHGTRVPVLVGAATLHGFKDRGVCFVIDVSERRRAQERLTFLAHHDPLTGIPNRTLFNDRLQQAVIDANRRERLVAVMFLDLDRFKTVNDTLGHDAGDALLKQAATRLKSAVREGDTVARLSGDEFTLVLGDINHVDDVSRLAQKILDAFARPFTVQERELFISVSIGITLYPFDDNNIEGLLRNADMAMYRAKEQGRNTYQFYAAEMTVNAHQRLAMENALRYAISRGQFVLHYQPIVDIASGAIVGMEALIRWQHPEWGLVEPDRFIPLAEETGLIAPIGQWVLETACAQLHAWHQQGIGPLRLGINISARQFEPRLVGVLMDIARRTGLDMHSLELELTETLLLKNAADTVATLQELDKIGVQVAIDDFGTGYSSLSYLKRFSIDTLKIDRSFVQDITTDADDAAIASAIIALAHSLGIRVIAEGVETAAQLEFIRAHGCDLAQGYYLSQPLAVPEFAALLRASPHLPRPPMTRAAIT